MKLLGRLLFIATLPFWRVYLRRTARVYVITEQNGEVLAVKPWLGRQDWHLPGGGVKKIETPRQALVRELQEEVRINISADKLRLIASGIWQTDSLGHKYQIFYCQLKTRPTVKLLRPELIKADWLKPSELNEANCSREILAALAGAGLL